MLNNVNNVKINNARISGREAGTPVKVNDQRTCKFVNKM